MRIPKEQSRKTRGIKTGCAVCSDADLLAVERAAPLCRQRLGGNHRYRRRTESLQRLQKERRGGNAPPAPAETPGPPPPPPGPPPAKPRPRPGPRDDTRRG